MSFPADNLCTSDAARIAAYATGPKAPVPYTRRMGTHGLVGIAAAALVAVAFAKGYVIARQRRS